MELSAVIFPDTVLSERMCIPLVPVFSTLVYLQPVENDHESAAGRSELAESLLQQSWCRLHAPAPLGADRDRFLRLIADLRNRRDDYALQLGHQTLAGISSASGKRSETKSSIVGSILAGHGIREDEGGRHRLLLWQARLLLKLAEMHMADQEEVSRQVQRIREKEQGMLSGLRDEEELPFALTGLLADMGMDSAALRQQRKAWARLLVLGEAVAHGGGVYVSRDRDSVELLSEEYTKETGSQPELLGRIPLPAGYPEPERFIGQVRRFRDDGADLLTRLHSKLAPIGAQPAALAEVELRAWATLLARWFPERECGRTVLSLFSCSGRSAGQLFAGAFAPEDRDFLALPATETATGVVLGLLEKD